MNQTNKINDELRLKIRLYNNRLIRAREELGLSARDAAEKIGVEYGHLLRLEALKKSPYDSRTQELTPTAKKILDFHGLSEDYVWPKEIARGIKQNYAKFFEMSLDDARQLAGPERIELDGFMGVLLEVLNCQERFVIGKIFVEEEEKKQIAKLMGVSGTRVGQIERRAILKLRKAASFQISRMGKGLSLDICRRIG
ncbi:MAG: sigma factor-like helix-turn-helix DNA-binding protein [Patescibacteria group bacterium]